MPSKKEQEQGYAVYKAHEFNDAAVQTDVKKENVVTKTTQTDAKKMLKTKQLKLSSLNT